MNVAEAIGLGLGFVLVFIRVRLGFRIKVWIRDYRHV